MDRKISGTQNPYVVGMPIKKKEKLFGRKAIFEKIDDCLNKQKQVTFLHGQRRIGKTSVLQQIPSFSQIQGFKFIYFDCQAFVECDQSRQSDALENIVNGLMDRIAESLLIEHSHESWQNPLENQKSNSFHLLFNLFIEDISNKFEGQKLVLLLDELDALNVTGSDGQNIRFFSFLRKVISDSDSLFAIATIGQRMDDFEKLDNLFPEAERIKVSFLDPDSSEKLILDLNRVTIKGKQREHLQYNQSAISCILKLTANHPYLIQGICSKIFDYGNSKNHYQISAEEVNLNVDAALKSLSGMQFFWESRTMMERLLMLALAEAETTATADREFLNPLALLREKYGIQIYEAIEKALKKLEEGEFIEVKEQGDSKNRGEIFCRIRIPLVSKWLKREYSLQAVIKGLEDFDQRAYHPYKKGIEYEERGDTESAIQSYKTTLNYNPNHVGVISCLAKLLLQQGNFTDSIKYLKRAAKLNREYASSLVEAQVKYCEQLILISGNSNYPKAQLILRDINSKAFDPGIDIIVNGFSEIAISLIEDIEERKKQASIPILSSEEHSADVKKNEPLISISKVSEKTRQVRKITISNLFAFFIVVSSFTLLTTFVSRGRQRLSAENIIVAAEYHKKNGEVIAALKELDKITTSNPYYHKAQEKVYDYSSEMLDEARKSVSTSTDPSAHWEAVYHLNRIPENTPAYYEAKELIEEYANARKNKK